MKKKFLQTIRFLAFLGLSVLLLYFAFRGIDFTQVKEVIFHAEYGWILFSFVFSILAFLSRARRWVISIEALNRKPSLWNTYHSMMFGYLANFAFPRIGEITRCVSLSRREKIPVDALIGTVILERALDLFMLLLIMITLLLARFQKFGAFFSDFIFTPLRNKISTTFGDTLIFWSATALIFLALALLGYIYRNKLYRFHVVTRGRDFIKGIVEGLKTIFRMEKKWEFIFHTFFIWFNYILMTWIVVFALPGITDHLTFMDGVFLLVIGGMGMSAPVQSGLGAFHWIVSRGLIFVYFIPKDEAVAFATLQHSSQMLLILFLGSISMLFLFLKNKRNAAGTVQPVKPSEHGTS